MTAFWAGVLWLTGIVVQPDRAAGDRYGIVAPLGRIASIATSIDRVFCVSDHYLVIMNRRRMTNTDVYRFDRPVQLGAYDMWFADLWLVTADTLVRFTPFSGSVRSFPLTVRVDSFAVGADALYAGGGELYRIDRSTGTTTPVAEVPAGLTWHKALTAGQLRRYPFLTPFHYRDPMAESTDPLRIYPITALHEDGVELYVGTNGYGLLRYNTLSLQMERAVYGPRSLGINDVRILGDDLYLAGDEGLSILGPSRQWRYAATALPVQDVVAIDSTLLVNEGQVLARLDKGLRFPLLSPAARITALTATDSAIYVGTTQGIMIWHALTGAQTLLARSEQAVQAIAVHEDRLYAGTSTAWLRYLPESGSWRPVINQGIAEAVGVGAWLYLRGDNRQLLRLSGENDQWELLPYYNINDIATDGTDLYCATVLGLSYLEASSGLMRYIVGLPREEYQRVVVHANMIYAFSRDRLYTLPTTVRD